MYIQIPETCDLRVWTIFPSALVAFMHQKWNKSAYTDLESLRMRLYEEHEVRSGKSEAWSN